MRRTPFGRCPGGRPGRAGMAAPVALFAALAASSGSWLAAQTGSVHPHAVGRDSTAHSEVRLVGDVASIRAGEPFTIGLHVTLDEGWRTPWQNAGDVGNGPIVEWTLPDGFSAGPVAYPIPERIANPPVTSYGYHDEVILLSTVTPPTDLVAGRPVRLGVSADFVICGHTCIPVHAEQSLELTVLDAPPAESADAALIRRYADRLPVENAQWTTRVARTEHGFVLDVVPPADWGRSLYGAWFFPADAALLDHVADQPVGRTAAGAYRVRLTESAYLQGEPDRIEGTLVLPDGGAFDSAGHRGLLVSASVEAADVAWAAEPTKPVAAPGSAAGQGAMARAGTVPLIIAVLLALVGVVILTPKIVPILNHKELT